MTAALRAILGLLTPAQRRSLVGLFVLMVIGMMLETLGVGLVLPAIALLTGEGVALISGLVPALAGLERGQLVVAGLLAVVGVFAVKAAFLAFLAWRQADFLYTTQADISERLFAGYLAQHYAFHLRRNSAQLIRNVMGETNAFAHGALNSALLLTAELLVATGLGLLLIVVEPVGALVVIAVLGAAAGLFLAVTRTRLRLWGEARQLHEGQRLQHLQQGLGGAKDVKLLGREAHFREQYAIHNANVARMGKREALVVALPRLWLELLAVSGLALLVFAMLAQGKPVEGFVATLGVFAAAAFRLVPSANRILNAMTALRYYMPVVRTLSGEMAIAEGADPARGEASPFARAIRLSGVGYRYPESDAPALADIDLVIARNATLGIIGGSGAGKSTLIDVLMGLLTPTTGTVEMDDRDVQQNLRAFQDQFGYVPQSIFLTDDTLRRNVAFGVREDRIDEAAVRRAIEAAQLGEFVAGLPDGLDTLVGERGVRLSGGQRQRIGIARALYHDPAILVLDEATSALDTATEQEVMRGVKLLSDKTVIIVAHRHSTVEHCRHIVRLENGRIVAAGPPEELLGGAAGPRTARAEP